MSLDTAEELVRVYRSLNARVAHVLVSWGSPNMTSPALCGAEPSATFWHGTGTWAEREHADELRLCEGCRRYLGAG